MSNTHFQKLVDSGSPVGEVISINRFLVDVKGLHPVNLRALVMFEDGSKGMVYRILDESVVVLHIDDTPLRAGMVAVVQHQELVCKVGKDYLGRVVSVKGEPEDGKGAIAADDNWPVFNEAPAFFERELVDTQLETGVVTIDALFPLVKGQRIAILGDSKSGKSALASQIAVHQKNTDTAVVYVMIGKRKSDIDALVGRLQQADAMKNAIIITSTVFDSPVLSYLAPYIATSMAEYLWQKLGRDVLIIYDDLTTHAYIHREIALLAGISPGRDSYPGDTFFAHSSLLERAGKLARNHRSLTSLPLVLTAGGDITGYLSTNLMSITDGQWILDMSVFHSGIRPAISVSQSVTRVGGRGHDKRQKQLASQVFRALGSYSQAQEFAHFGSELALATKKDLEQGKLIYDVLTQQPHESYNLMAQSLMLDIVLGLGDNQAVDVQALKLLSPDYGSKIKSEKDFEAVREQLKARSLLELKR